MYVLKIITCILIPHDIVGISYMYTVMYNVMTLYCSTDSLRCIAAGSAVQSGESLCTCAPGDQVWSSLALLCRV